MGCERRKRKKTLTLKQMAAAHCHTTSPHTNRLATMRCRHQRGRLVKIVAGTGDQEMCRTLRRSPALPLCSPDQVSRRAARPVTVPVAMVSRAT